MESRTILLVGKKCIQCHICEIVCPTKSIVFHANNKGFIVPYITSKCINCGKCLSSCPTIEFNKKDFLTTRPIRTIYGYSNDTINLFESSSGGIFIYLLKSSLIRI